MASGLSEEQRLKIEENRQRALALRAARQQQQLSVAADGGRKSSAGNNCQLVTATSSARPLSSSHSSSTGTSSTYVRQSTSTSYPRKTAHYSCTVSSGSKPSQPTTLADTSNRAASAVSSFSRAELNAAVPVRCCLISRQKFAADARYFAPLIEVFKAIPSKQYGDNLNFTFSHLIAFVFYL